MRKFPRKYIFVVGGVMSGVGKGIASSSIGKILQFHNLNVTAVKIDPYVNVDAGTMNPTEHGEAFILDDGHECDQDMGNYERFLNKSLRRSNYMTTGSIYLKVIQKERSLGYGGRCVDVVPDVPFAVIEQIKEAGRRENADIVMVEIGGTLGEYQNILFLEAGRMLRDQHPEDVLFVMVSYLPIPSKIGEMKTKPTQYAVRTMRQTGVSPDIILGRSPREMDDKRKEKLSVACSLPKKAIISAPDVKSIYDVPGNFMTEGLDWLIIEKLKIPGTRFSAKKSDQWDTFVRSSKPHNKEVRVAVVGKYFDTGDFVLTDAYISVIEALKFSAYKNGVDIDINWFNSKKLEGKGAKDIAVLKEFDGIVVPGGFGSSGIEGKINAIRYAREQGIPFLGLCYGMQLASIEYARNVCGIAGATSYELDPDAKDKVITIMPAQEKLLRDGNYGGSMRLGAYPAVVREGTLAHKIYGTTEISERHRHRYELNPEYGNVLEENGLVISATSPDGVLAEIIELPDHPFFLATQFHPEMKARPLDPHPIFTEFLRVASE